MNLKEAFRFQNKLQSMMADAQSILGNNGNITKVQNTYLRHKVMAEVEDEVTMEAPSTEYSENITEMAEFLLFLLDEREKLSAAIHQAKVSLPLGAGLDGEVSLNGKRQEIATLLRHMAGLRNGEVLISNGGVGYRFNNRLYGRPSSKHPCPFPVGWRYGNGTDGSRRCLFRRKAVRCVKRRSRRSCYGAAEIHPCFLPA